RPPHIGETPHHDPGVTPRTLGGGAGGWPGSVRGGSAVCGHGSVGPGPVGRRRGDAPPPCAHLDLPMFNTFLDRRRVMSTDAIVLLKEDHKEIRGLFRDFEAAGKGAAKTKGKIVDRIIELLTVHTYIENEVMYPRVRALLPDLEDDILESYEEHHVADVLVMELYGMSPGDERFDAKATVLIESVRHHIKEEEDEWLPKVREGLGRKALQEIGEEMLAAKQSAPREPSQPSALKKSIDAVIS